MLYLYIFLILLVLFTISINRKRIPPNSSNNNHHYITSPIDGKITNINLVKIDTGNNETKVFTEVVIQAHLLSSPYLYSPIASTMKIFENNLDHFIVEFRNKNISLKVSLGWSSIINKANYPILKNVKTYYGDYFQTGEPYGCSLFFHYVKILIPADSIEEKNNTITASIGQHVIGGESIISHD